MNRRRDGGSKERSLAIRRSGPDESELHFELQRAASLVGLLHVFPPDEFPYPDDAVLERWRMFRGVVLVAEQESTAVGLAAIDACWLHGLYVVPEAWGSGVALALHDAALAALPDCAEVRLWVLEENRRARRFYEKHGWRRNGETRVVEYPPSPLDVGYSFIREEP
jgi:RimJ/RimL family protein N-acetyltransferase